MPDFNHGLFCCWKVHDWNVCCWRGFHNWKVFGWKLKIKLWTDSNLYFSRSSFSTNPTPSSSIALQFITHNFALLQWQKPRLCSVNLGKLLFKFEIRGLILIKTIFFTNLTKYFIKTDDFFLCQSQGTKIDVILRTKKTRTRFRKSRLQYPRHIV